MTEAARPRTLPSLAEAGGWIGYALDAADGADVGRVHSVFVDAESAEPAWLIVELRRRSLLPGRRAVGRIAVPVRDCAGAEGRVWTAHEGGGLRGAPRVDASRALLREHELAICAHYGIGERVGRAVEVVGRPEGSVTSKPA